MQKGIFWRSRERELFRKFFWGRTPDPKFFSMKWIIIPSASFLHLSDWIRSRQDFYFQDQSFVSSIFVQYTLEDGVILSILEWRSMIENIFLLCKRAFSNVLEQAILENFSGASSHTPKCLSNGLITSYVKVFFHRWRPSQKTFGL